MNSLKREGGEGCSNGDCIGAAVGWMEREHCLSGAEQINE